MSLVSTVTRRVPHFWRSVTFGAISALSAVCLLGISAFLISSAALQPAILTLNAVIVAVRAFAFSRAGFRYVERLDGHNGAFKMMKALRVAIYERIVPLAPKRLGGHSRADLVHTLVEDVDAQQDAVVRVREPLWISAITLVVAIAGVAVISVNAAWVLLVAVALAIVFGAWLPARLHQSELSQIASREAELDNDVDNAVSTLRMQLAYDVADNAKDQVTAAQHGLAKAVRAGATAGAMTNAIILLVLGGATIGCLAVAAADAAWGAFPGTFVAVIVLVPLSLVESTSLAASAMQHHLRVNASKERLEDLVDGVRPITEAEDVADATLVPSGVLLQVRDGEIGWESPSLTGINLQLAQGETTLIRGASGRGKSTLAATIAGLIEPLGGSWQLMGRDMRQLDSAVIRENCVLVEQHAHLFSGSVRQNLLLAAPNANDSALESVLHSVGLDEDLAARQGLDTEVGEFGERLSGGQAQRLALARAMLVAAPIIVLDEPTASVDPEQSAEITRALLDAARNAEHHPAVVLLTHEQVPEELINNVYDLDTQAVTEAV